MKEFDREYFLNRKISFALIKSGRVVFRSKDQGLKPLIFCIKKYGVGMFGALVFDKVIGRAAACLLVCAQVKEVMTPLVSESAIKLLKEHKIKLEYAKKIKNILNREGNDLCPMEKKSAELAPEKFCAKLGVPAPELVVKQSKYGEGVYANRNYKKEEKIVDFHGHLFPYEKMPFPYNEVTDHYVQVGLRTFMGPSGGIDDYFNHSCDPNAGLVIRGKKVFLKAIKTIKKGQEITWDYSTTMYERQFPDKWEMDCDCGSAKCRRLIVDFKDLPKNLRTTYIKAGVVPGYILKIVK